MIRSRIRMVRPTTEFQQPTSMTVPSGTYWETGASMPLDRSAPCGRWSVKSSTLFAFPRAQRFERRPNPRPGKPENPNHQGEHEHRAHRAECVDGFLQPGGQLRLFGFVVLGML